MHVGIVHGGSQRTVKHPHNHIVPGGRVTDKIGLQVVKKLFPSFGGGAVHNRSRVCEPGGSHDHSLSALPINFALLYALVLEMVKKAARQQRQQGRRETMRLLVLEAVVAGDVAFGGWKKNNAEDSATHIVSLLVGFRVDATYQVTADFVRETGYFPETRGRCGRISYHRLIQLPRGGPHRLIQPPRGPHRLIQPPRRGPHRLIQPPRRGPHRLIQTPALTFGAETNQATPNTAAAIAAPDHFPMPCKNKRLSCNSAGSSEPFIRKDGSSFIAAQSEVSYDSLIPWSVSSEKCMVVITHLPPFFAAVSDMLTGNVTSFPSFFMVTFPEVIIQPVSGLTSPTLYS